MNRERACRREMFLRRLVNKLARGCDRAGKSGECCARRESFAIGDKRSPTIPIMFKRLRHRVLAECRKNESPLGRYCGKITRSTSCIDRGNTTMALPPVHLHIGGYRNPGGMANKCYTGNATGHRRAANKGAFLRSITRWLESNGRRRTRLIDARNGHI